MKNKNESLMYAIGSLQTSLQNLEIQMMNTSVMNIEDKSLKQGLLDGYVKKIDSTQRAIEILLTIEHEDFNKEQRDDGFSR